MGYIRFLWVPATQYIDDIDMPATKGSGRWGPGRGYMLDNARIDAHVDGMTLVDAWRAKGGNKLDVETRALGANASSPTDVAAFKRKCRLSMCNRFNQHFSVDIPCSWMLSCGCTSCRATRPTDPPSWSFSRADAKLSPQARRTVEQRFGPNVIDGMALPSNARTSMYFSWFPTPGAAGVNVFAQPLGQYKTSSENLPGTCRIPPKRPMPARLLSPTGATYPAGTVATGT
ncbi:hypothetical protein Bbelb_082700 [Branchiostoma belcheri]|nr:hypothetical protein Bbelb_082700 [Branchiostoma belcheri]